MDGMTSATTESRNRGQRKVLVATTGAGLAALAVTGALTVGLGAGVTAATSTGSTAPSSTTGTSSDSTSTSSVTTSVQPPVASSGGS